jgi:hypothetical protein
MDTNLPLDVRTLYLEGSPFAHLAQIPTKDLPKCAISLENYTQEAEELCTWVVTDAQALVAVGLKREILDGLPQRIAICREAQTRWNTYRLPRNGARQQLSRVRLRALAAKKELLQALCYAHQDEAGFGHRLRQDMARQNYASLVQNLIDLAVMAESRGPALELIGFDLALIDRAQALSDELGKLVVQVVIEKEDLAELRLLRDRAFAHLKAAVDAIRAAGKYAFVKDAEKRRCYASRFRRRKKPGRTEDAAGA